VRSWRGATAKQLMNIRNKYIHTYINGWRGTNCEVPTPPSNLVRRAARCPGEIHVCQSLRRMRSTPSNKAEMQPKLSKTNCYVSFSRHANGMKCSDLYEPWHTDTSKEPLLFCCTQHSRPFRAMWNRDEYFDEDQETQCPIWRMSVTSQIWEESHQDQHEHLWHGTIAKQDHTIEVHLLEVLQSPSAKCLAKLSPCCSTYALDACAMMR
jgi:hypothetical protein